MPDESDARTLPRPTLVHATLGIAEVVPIGVRIIVDALRTLRQALNILQGGMRIIKAAGRPTNTYGIENLDTEAYLSRDIGGGRESRAFRTDRA